MKIKDHREYNPELPENAPWEHADSERLSRVAAKICKAIRGEYAYPIRDRHRIAGLREALRIMAEEGEIFDGT